MSSLCARTDVSEEAILLGYIAPENASEEQNHSIGQDGAVACDEEDAVDGRALEGRLPVARAGVAQGGRISKLASAEDGIAQVVRDVERRESSLAECDVERDNRFFKMSLVGEPKHSK